MAVGKGEFKVRLELKPSGVELQQIFERAGQQFGDWRPALQMLPPIIRAGFIEAFRTKGASLEHAWPALKRNYLRRKLRERRNPDAMLRTGRLFRSLWDAPIRGMTKSRISVGLTAGRVGASLPRLQFKFGRWIVGWSPRMISEANEVLARYIDQIFAQAAATMNSYGGRR